MDKLVKSFSSSKEMKKKDDDFSDRLNNRYTVIILVVFAVIVSMSNYVGKPITCWAPKHFTGGWTKYANNYCWVRNTYYLPYEENIPKEDEHHDYILYYQWVPFILLAQAFFFYLPSIVWHGLNQKAGIDADSILETACKLASTKEDKKRCELLKVITVQLDRFLKTRRDKEKHSGLSKALDVISCSWISRRLNSYLVILFIVTKALYVTNVVLQFIVLGVLLKTNFGEFAIQYFHFMRLGDYYSIAPIFPRVTMCDFHVRFLGNVQRYTLQCVLPINLFIEKMYLFIWFWMLFLITFTSASLLMWIFRALCSPDRKSFLKNHVGRHESNADILGDFMNLYLKQDGAFLLRLIAHNTNYITTSDIANALYLKFSDRQCLLQRRNEDVAPLHKNDANN